MAPEAILLPSIAMMLLTTSLIGVMGVARFRATARREVSLKYYQLYRDGEEPAHLRLLTRHVQNHFEVPPLFHAGVLMTYASGLVTTPALVLAWGFVVLRALHTAVHLRGNNVRRRFGVFGASLLALVALWVMLLIGLLARL